jgi:NADH:ubiquinone reductase (H+-translocating)
MPETPETIEYIKIANADKPRVLIIGGGFGGLELAKALEGADVQVVLIDKNNFHTFQPLLYQVSASALEPESIVYPYRKIFDEQKNFYFRLAEVKCIHPETSCVETSIGYIKYDYLVMATGSTTNFYGMEDIEKYAIPLKGIDDAIQLRNNILSNFEQALLEKDEEKINSLMDYVIVGGGPTGVEVAGALSELRKHVFPNDYKELNFRDMDIHLVQSGNRLLDGMSEESSKKALEYLQAFGVNVILGHSVKAYDGYTVTLDNGEKLITRTLLWAAGVSGNPVAGIRPESFSKGRRLSVDVYNRVTGYDNIFAIGDVAAMVSEQRPKGFAMMAQPAIQQGHRLASNLQCLLRGKPMTPFEYNDKGSMATIGRNRGVVESKWIKTQGFLGWFIWAFVHLFFLVGFRNRIVVFINWIVSYLSYDKGIRLIIGPHEKIARDTIEKDQKKEVVL